MIGKLFLGAGAVVALWEGSKWWKSHKSQHAFRGGHDYVAIFDITKAPIAPLDPSSAQAALQAAYPGQYTVIGADTDALNKQVKLTFEALSDEYLSGDELVKALGFAAGFGTVTLASITDAGAVSAQGGGAIPFAQ